jgi:hypothetical protein
VVAFKLKRTTVFSKVVAASPFTLNTASLFAKRDRDPLFLLALLGVRL